MTRTQVVIKLLAYPGNLSCNGEAMNATTNLSFFLFDNTTVLYNPSRCITNETVTIVAQDLIDQIYAKNTLFLYAVLALVMLNVMYMFIKTDKMHPYLHFFISVVHGFTVVYCFIWSLSFIL